MLTDTERLIMTVVAYGVAGIVLVAISETPAYPVAIGIEVVVITILLMYHGTDIAAKLTMAEKAGGLVP